MCGRCAGDGGRALGRAAALLRLLVGWRQATPLKPTGSRSAFAVAVSVATGVLFGLVPRCERREPISRHSSPTPPRPPSGGAWGGHWWLAGCAVSRPGRLAPACSRGPSRALTARILLQRENLLLFEIDPERNGYKDAEGPALQRTPDREIERSARGSCRDLLGRPCCPGGPTPLPPRPTGGSFPAAKRGPLQSCSPQLFSRRWVCVSCRDRGRRETDPDHRGGERVPWARAYFPTKAPSAISCRQGAVVQPERAYRGALPRMRNTTMRDVPHGSIFDRRQEPVASGPTRCAPPTMPSSWRSRCKGDSRNRANLAVFNVRTQRMQIQEHLVGNVCRPCLDRLWSAGVAARGRRALRNVVVLSWPSEQGRLGFLALGAAAGSRADDLRGLLVTAGISATIGLPTALALARFVSSSLFGVAPDDGMAVLFTILVLCVGLAPPARPASRAARMIPSARCAMNRPAPSVGDLPRNSAPGSLSRSHAPAHCIYV